jgi:hypothetical protein
VPISLSPDVPPFFLGELPRKDRPYVERPHDPLRPSPIFVASSLTQPMAGCPSGLLVACKRRRHGHTRPGRGRWRAPDLVGLQLAAQTLNRKWYDDGTEIGTEEGTSG